MKAGKARYNSEKALANYADGRVDCRAGMAAEFTLDVAAQASAGPALMSRWHWRNDVATSLVGIGRNRAWSLSGWVFQIPSVQHHSTGCFDFTN